MPGISLLYAKGSQNHILISSPELNLIIISIQSVSQLAFIKCLLYTVTVLGTGNKGKAETLREFMEREASTIVHR